MSVTYDFAPTYIFCIVSFDNSGKRSYLGGYNSNYNACNGIKCDALTTSFENGFTFGTCTEDTSTTMKKSSDGKTIYWYSTSTTYFKYTNSSGIYVLMGVC